MFINYKLKARNVVFLFFAYATPRAEAKHDEALATSA